MRIRRFLSVLAFLFLVAPSLTRATTLEVVNLENLVLHSETIFTGQCLSVVSGLDANGLPYTQYSFHVSEMFRGVPAEQVTVKQFGYSSSPVPGGRAGAVTRIAGMPEYLPSRPIWSSWAPQAISASQPPSACFRGPSGSTMRNRRSTLSATEI